MSSIDHWREEISACDREIVRQLHRRAEAALEIGRHKQARGEPFYDAARQKLVLRQAMETASEGAFPAEGLRHVFQEIMSVCLNMERPTKIGFLGPAGTFTHLAARVEFGATPEFHAYATIEDIFVAAEREWVDYGVVPIENSTGGMVHTTLDAFLASDVLICSEILLDVHQCLLARGARAGIRRIYSHPQGFAQCRMWLRRNMPGVELVEAGSTAQGVERALAEEDAAAIGCSLAAEVLSINILEANIEDHRDNVTRFLVVGKHPAKTSGHDRTSLLFGAPDKPGALHEILGVFARAGVNLTKIENRPSQQKAWDYVFFADLEGHAADSNVAAAIDELRAVCGFVRVLGSYPIDLTTRTAPAAPRLPEEQEN